MTDEQLIEELEAEESMFVQTARGITSEAGTLTLRDVTRRRCTSPIARSGSSGTCPLLSSLSSGARETTASRRSRRTRCSRSSSPATTFPKTR